MENLDMNTKKSILFIVKNENEASSRFRVFGYLPYIRSEFKFSFFFSEFNNKKIPKILRSLVKRVRFIYLLIQVKKYDIVFMQRPMSSDKSISIFFEKLLKIINKNLIFDFDDALFLINEKKISDLISISKNVICGNKFLASYSKNYNLNTYVIPTVIDTEKFLTKTSNSDSKFTIGWTGTSGNYQFFSDSLIHALTNILHKYDIKILFICDKKPPEKFTFEYDFIKWNDETELKDLHKIDLGIMPLSNSKWSKGKAGFKLIQYGAIGIPSIASNVGVNNQIIEDNITGYLVNTDKEDWYEKFELILNDKEKSQKMGQYAREKIEKEYSIKSQYSNFKNILDITCEK